MDLVPDSVFRALRYIEMVSQQGVSPTANQVDAFAYSTGPTKAAYSSPVNMFIDNVTWSKLIGGTKTKDGETVSSYLKRMGWTDTLPDDHVGLTALGRAFVQALQRESVDVGDIEAVPATLVLEPSDSLSQVELTQATAQAGKGMLVDPYFKAQAVQ